MAKMRHGLSDADIYRGSTNILTAPMEVQISTLMRALYLVQSHRLRGMAMELSMAISFPWCMTVIGVSGGRLRLFE